MEFLSEEDALTSDETLICSKLCRYMPILQLEEKDSLQIVKKVNVTANNSNHQVMEVKSYPPFNGPANAILAKIICEYAFNPAGGVTLGVIYEDTSKYKLSERYKIAIHKLLLLDYAMKCVSCFVSPEEQCIDNIWEDVTGMTNWIPSLANVKLIRQLSPAVNKINEEAEQSYWLDFSFNQYLSLRERCFIYCQCVSEIIPSLMTRFNRRLWQHDKIHMLPGIPYKNKYYVQSHIHIIAEKIQQHGIISLFLWYNGSDCGILQIKKHFQLISASNDAFWSGHYTTNKYLEIWVNGHMDGLYKCDADENVKYWWCLIFEEPYPGDVVDKALPISHHWTQTSDTLNQN